MNVLSRWAGVVFACLLASACEPQQASAPPASQPEAQQVVALPKAPGKFDFYVLALSWSPSYCQAQGTGGNPQQCGADRSFAFVVHGLWPQFERGYPTDCKTDVARVPEDLASGYYDIMPSLSLIGHEWRRHGSCTGLAPEDYFATVRAARERVIIPVSLRHVDAYKAVAPAEVEQSFIDTNPGMTRDAISVSCDNRLLSEVRVCMTRDLEFRACSELERRSCRTQNLVMPPVRG